MVSPTMEVATAVMLTYSTAILFAAGYLLRWQDIPRYWIWCAPSRHLRQEGCDDLHWDCPSYL